MIYPQQQPAFDFLEEWLQSKEQLACLQGYAGTGKTWLVGFWLAEVLKAHPRWTIYVLAPTNKALDVLREKCGKLGSRVAFFTIDSFLGNRIKRDEDGEIQKSYGKGQENPDLIVCDEASMIKKEYDTSLRRRGVKTLYVGDPAQLPPINEDISSTFTVERKFLMTEVVRFEGSIIKIATMLRKRIESKEPFFVQQLAELREDNTVSFIRQHKVHEWAMTAVEKGMDSRIVAFENATVNQHNAIMHRNLFPDDALFGVNEKVIVNETYDLNNDDMLYNGELLTVQKCERADDAANVAIYNVTFTRDATPDFYIDGELQEKGTLTLPVALDEGKMIFRRKELTDQIWQARKDGQSHAYIRGLLDLRAPLNRLAPLRHSYSCTVHKSQGSTYDITFLDWPSIFRCQDRARMMYVAATRPSKYLVVGMK